MSNRRTLERIIATGAGIGSIPGSPGTYGSIEGIAIWWLIRYFNLPWFTELAILICVIAIGIYAASHYEKTAGKHDPAECVIDEIAGMMLSLFLLPAVWQWVLPAFLLFRFLDITKPWLIDRTQSLPHGWGIMADDIAAGIVTVIILHSLRYFIL
jgi:phosphatidylglycerophosphatase A